MMLHQHPGGLELTQRLLEYCAFPANATVVDVGCGTGGTVEYLHDHCGIRAIGIDTSTARLELGRKRAADLWLLQEHSETLPFMDGSMDGVIAECSLSVMQDIAKVVHEWGRILVAGGKVGITDLYVKKQEHTSASCYLPGPGRPDGCAAEQNLLTILRDNHFRILAWQDQSVYLREFVASYIMKYGLTEELRQCLFWREDGNGCRSETKKSKLGYFLLVAEKRVMEG